MAEIKYDAAFIRRLKALAEAGKTRQQCATELGLSYPVLRQLTYRLGKTITFIKQSTLHHGGHRHVGTLASRNVRPCMNCRRDFGSWGNANRLCMDCRARSKEMTPWD